MQHRFFRSGNQPGRTPAPCLFLRQLTCLAALIVSAAGPVAAQNVIFDNVGITNDDPAKQITLGGVEMHRLGILTDVNAQGRPVSHVEVPRTNRFVVDATEFFAPDNNPNNTTTFQRYRAADNFTTLHFGSNSIINLSRVDVLMSERVDLADVPVDANATPVSGFQGLYVAIFQDPNPNNPNQNPLTTLNENIRPTVVAGGFGDQDLSDGFQTNVNNRLMTGPFAPEFVGYRVIGTEATDEERRRRPIFRLSADLSGITLGPGNYFISISAIGSELSNPVGVVPFTPRTVADNPDTAEDESLLSDPYRPPNPELSNPLLGPTDPYGMAQPDDPGGPADANNPVNANAMYDPNSSVFILFDAHAGTTEFEGVELPFALFGQALVMPEAGTVALMLTGGLPVLGMALRRVTRRRRGQKKEESGQEAA